MKRILIALAVSTALTGGVYAGDLNHRGGLKDPVERQGRLPDPEPVVERSSNHSGFYIKGDLGIARGDRDVNVTVDREKGEFEIEPAVVDDPQTPENEAKPAVRTEIADWIDRLSSGESDDFDAMVFGGELSYLYRPQGSRLGFEGAIGGTFYNDSETKHSFEDGVATITGGLNSEDPGCAPFCVGDPAGTSQSGWLSVKRQYDIDLVGRVHYFLTNDLAINAGGGLSLAKAKIKGGAETNSVIGGGAYDTSFNDSDTSLGYVLTAGATYWATDRITVGISYDYKHHEFETDAGGTTDSGSVYRSVHTGIDVEDDVHTIKGRIGFKLNGVEEALR